MDNATLVFGVTMLAFLFIIGVLLIYDRCSGSRSKKRDKKRGNEQFDYVTVDLDLMKYGWTCSVCLNGAKESEPVVETRCGHRFHQTCLDHWLRNGKYSPSCPTCRTRINDAAPKENNKDVVIYIGDNEEVVEELEIVPL